MIRFRAASISTLNSLLGKRTKIAISTLIATILSWVVLSLEGNLFTIVFILSLLLIVSLVLWSFSQDLIGVKYLIIPALPILYLGSYIWLVKLLDLTAAGIFTSGVVLSFSFYFLLLTQNIYNIAAERSIGLVRAAAVSGTVFYVITAFLAYGVFWFQNWPFWLLILAIFAISFILFLLAIWSTHLDEITKKDLIWSAILSLVVTEFGLAFSFWPVLPLIAALVLAISFYVILGLTQFQLQERLTKNVVYEYLIIAGVVLVLILVTTRWGG